MTASPDRARAPLLWSCLAVVIAAGTLGAAFAPSLLVYSPLLLIALSPLGRHMVLVAPLTDLLPFVAVATSRRLVVCTLAYLLGRTYGDDGVSWVRASYPRMARLLDALEALFRRAGPVVLFVAPGPIFCALAGVTRMRGWLFFPIATAGQLAWAVITYQVGDALSAWIMPIVEWVRAHIAETTLACALLVLAYEWQRRRRRRNADPSRAATDASPP